MPQMFPMPAVLLLIMTSALYFTGIIRTYWWRANYTSLPSDNHPYLAEVSLSNFNQTW